MNLSLELNQLQELPTPPLPPLWPQTWGWWLLLAALLALAGIALVTWQHRRQANAYRRTALAQLDRVSMLWQQTPDDPGPLREIPGILKQAVQARLGPDTPGIAGMSGDAWQHQLASMARTPLPSGFAQALAQLAYADDRSVQGMDLAGLIAACRHWLETHHDPV